jgi:hypothetical protein
VGNQVHDLVCFARLFSIVSDDEDGRFLMDAANPYVTVVFCVQFFDIALALMISGASFRPFFVWAGSSIFVHLFFERNVCAGSLDCTV